MSVIYLHGLKFILNFDKKLFSLSVLSCILIPISFIAGGTVPLFGIVISGLLVAGIRKIFLASYIKRQEHKTEEIFSGFSDFRHVAAGMTWTFFKTYVWLLIPVAGIFISVMKAYEYRFVPYILMTRKEVKALDAPDVSSKETDGFRAYMFATDALMFASLLLTELFLYLLSLIPYVGIIFSAMMVLLMCLFAVFLPYIRNVLFASFYTEIKTKCILPLRHSRVCPVCLTKLDGNDAYCSNCGEKVLDLKQQQQ